MNTDYQPLQQAEEKMQKTLQYLQTDLASIRAGRANPQVLNKIMVNYYGTPTPLPKVGNVSVPEPRMIVISLWDASVLKEAEKAIISSDLGIHPSNDGKSIRLVFPELTQERRQELVKTVKKRAEEAKVSMRAIRRDVNEVLKKDKKASTITEDDLKDLEEKTQKLTDQFIKKVDEEAKGKEKEILEV